jgi:hypothetical protein
MSLVAVLSNVETCVLDPVENAVGSKVVDSVDTALNVPVLVAVAVDVVIGVLDAVDFPVKVSVVTWHAAGTAKLNVCGTMSPSC